MQQEAFFRKVQFAWNQLGLAAKSYKVRDLWDHKSLGRREDLTVTLPAHASILYRAEP